MSGAFEFACPECRLPLKQITPTLLTCTADRMAYPQIEGIWRFLPRQVLQELKQFMSEYEAVRLAEGRGTLDPAYYRALPFKDVSGQFTSQWKIRASSFRALINSVVAPMEKRSRRRLKVLDLGAGNGWLSYRLAQRGHLAAAVDLQTNILDGLGAFVHYDADFLPIQADFNHLPLQDGQADLVIFNASFHYTTSYRNSLEEALRVLEPAGRVVILDTPIYREEYSGAVMVREREAQFRMRYGFASNAIPSENYLTYKNVDQLAKETSFEWKLLSAWYGLGWAARPLRARLAGRREPAQFRILIGQKQA